MTWKKKPLSTVGETGTPPGSRAPLAVADATADPAIDPAVERLLAPLGVQGFPYYRRIDEEPVERARSEWPLVGAVSRLLAALAPGRRPAPPRPEPAFHVATEAPVRAVAAPPALPVALGEERMAAASGGARQPAQRAGDHLLDGTGDREDDRAERDDDEVSTGPGAMIASAAAHTR